MVFSDESAFDVAPVRSQFVRRRSDERPSCAHTAQHRPFLQRVMVWGCFSYEGPGKLTLVEGNLKQDGYLSILQQHLVPQIQDWFDEEPCFFQQDNAPCHKSARVMHFLRQQQFQVLDWPPFSPDLSPIENLWAIVKKKVHMELTMNKEELFARLWIIWMEDPEIKKACQALIEGIPRRIQSCIDAKGGPIKY